MVTGVHTISPSCRSSSEGNEVIFSIQLEPDYELNIGMDSNAYDSIHETRWGGDCPGQNLVACTDDPDTVRHSWANDQSTAQTVYFIIDAFSSSGSGAFTLTWTIIPLFCTLAGTVDLASITSPYTGNTATDGAFVQHMPPVFKRPQRNRN